MSSPYSEQARSINSVMDVLSVPTHLLDIARFMTTEEAELLSTIQHGSYYPIYLLGKKGNVESIEVAEEQTAERMQFQVVATDQVGVINMLIQPGHRNLATDHHGIVRDWCFKLTRSLERYSIAAYSLSLESVVNQSTARNLQARPIRFAMVYIGEPVAGLVIID